MRAVWVAIGLSGVSLLAAASFRYRDPGVETGIRTAASIFSTGMAAYAIYRSRQERQLDELRASHSAIRNELSGSMLECLSEYYAQNIGAMMRGEDAPPEAIEAWFAREYAEPAAELSADPDGAGGVAVAAAPAAPAAAPAAAPTAAPTAAPAAAATSAVQWFDWEELRDGDRHPHILILGGSGNGKSTLLEWIARTIAPDGKPEVWTTKRKGLQWHGLETYGIPRDFDAIADRYNEALAEMVQRFGDLDADFDEMVIAWDEISACVAERKDLSPSPFFREAREARIRVIAAPHGGQVGSIGLDGQSDILASVTQIRIGKLAIAHAEKLHKRGDWSDEMASAFLDLDRPCLVDDVPAIVPHLPKGWQVGDEMADDLDAVLAALTDYPTGATVRTLQRTRHCKAMTADRIREVLAVADGVESWEERGTTMYRSTAITPVLTP